MRLVTLSKGAPSAYHVETATDALIVNPIQLASYDMLLAWGLTRNPLSVKLYRANSANEAVYNGITFRFQLSEEITENS